MNQTDAKGRSLHNIGNRSAHSYYSVKLLTTVRHAGVLLSLSNVWWREPISAELHIKIVKLFRRCCGRVFHYGVAKGAEKTGIWLSQAELDVVAPPRDHHRGTIWICYGVASVVSLLPFGCYLTLLAVPDDKIPQDAYCMASEIPPATP